MLSKIIDYFTKPDVPEPNVNVPEEKIEKMPGKDISEPVFSFVETVRNDPGRFKFKIIQSYFQAPIGIDAYSITDKQCKHIHKYYLSYDIERMRYYKERHNYSGNISFPKNTKLSFLTSDELEYLRVNLREIFKSKKERLDRLREYRKNRDKDTCREYYKTIYCSGDKT